MSRNAGERKFPEQLNAYGFTPKTDQDNKDPDPHIGSQGHTEGMQKQLAELSPRRLLELDPVAIQQKEIRVSTFLLNNITINFFSTIKMLSIFSSYRFKFQLKGSNRSLFCSC